MALKAGGAKKPKSVRALEALDAVEARKPMGGCGRVLIGCHLLPSGRHSLVRSTCGGVIEVIPIHLSLGAL